MSHSLSESEVLGRLRAAMRSRRDSWLVQQGRQAVTLFPHSADLWMAFGEVLLVSDEECTRDELIRCYERAAELAPSRPDVWQELGRILDVLPGDLERAEGCLRRAIALGAGEESSIMLARVLAQRGKKAEALELLGQLVQGESEDAQVLRDEIWAGVWDSMDEDEPHESTDSE